MRGNGLKLCGFIEAFAGGFEDGGGEVRGEDFDVPILRRIRRFEKDHGDGVGFLAGGAPGGPTAERVDARLLFSLEKVGEELIFEMGEMVGLTEEAGEICGECVDEVHKFTFIIDCETEVVREGVMGAEPHAFGDSGLDELAFSIV